MKRLKLAEKGGKLKPNTTQLPGLMLAPPTLWPEELKKSTCNPVCASTEFTIFTNLLEDNPVASMQEPGGGGRAAPVRTATLVAPRTTPSALAKRTKIRFVAGSKGTVPLAVMKMPKVGVALALLCVVTLLAGGETHAPVAGFVSHSVRLRGKLAPPVFAVAVIAAATAHVHRGHGKDASPRVRVDIGNAVLRDRCC